MTYDYSQTQNEGQGYADQWNQWVQQQPWFQQALREMQQQYARTPESAGRYQVRPQILGQFMARVTEQSKKLGHLPPQDFQYAADGRLSQRDFLDRNPWFYAVMLGGAAAGGIAAGAGLGASTAPEIALTGTSTTAAAAPSTLAGAVTGGGAAAAGGSSIWNAAKTGADVAGSARGLTGGGSNNERVIAALAGLTPLLARQFGNSGQSSDGGIFGGDNEKKSAVLAQIEQMLKLQNQRATDSVPIHQAALRLAGQLAPTSNSSPRLDAAIGQAGSPAGGNPIDPHISAAIQRLMGPS